MNIIILIFFNLIGFVYLLEINQNLFVKNKTLKLLSIDVEGNIDLEADSLEELRKLDSFISITSSIGVSRSGKSTILNLILEDLKCFQVKDLDNEYNLRNDYDIRWVNNNNINNLLNLNTNNINHIMFDTESLIMGRNINSSIKLIMLILMISDTVLINAINEIDIVFIDFIRSLITQTILFSSLFIRKLNELNMINKKTLKRNLIFLIENLHKTHISWLIHSNRKLNNENNLKEFSENYKNKLKSKIETYIWPENNKSNIFKNLNSFIERFNFYMIPYIGDDNSLLEDISFNLKNTMKHIFEHYRNYENRLTGSEIVEVIELFSEHSYLFNSLKHVDISNSKNEVNTNLLFENTLFIFSTRLEDQLLSNNLYPLLEIEADVIYNNTLKDIVSYWSSISKFDYFDTKNLFKNIESHFENLYKSILNRNCELIKSHCLSVINIHISRAIKHIEQFKERIPISQYLFSEFTDNLYKNTLKDIEVSLNKSFGNFESKVNSYSNSPCCNIDRSISFEKIRISILEIKEKNYSEIEKIINNDIFQAKEAMKKIDNVNETYYKLNKYEFEKKLQDLLSSSRLTFNSHLNLVNETSIQNKYISKFQLEVDKFILDQKNIWDIICRKHSFNFAKSLAIKENISIRNKLTLPLADNVILKEFERLRNDVIQEMNNIYCYNESSWKHALNELMNIIEDDKDQLMRENLIALKNLLHRPLQYALKNAIEITKQYINWSNFVKEATLVAISSLQEFDNIGSINIDNKTRDRIIELWIEQDLLNLKTIILKNQIFTILKYILYSVLFAIISFIIIFRNNSKIILIFILFSFIGSITLFSIIEFGLTGDMISQQIINLFTLFGFSKFTIYYIKYHLFLIITLIMVITLIITHITFNIKLEESNVKKNKLKNLQEKGHSIQNEPSAIRTFVY